MIQIEGYPAELRKPCVLFDNVFEKGVVSFFRGEPSGPNAYDENTYDVWDAPLIPTSIKVDLAVEATVDCMCLARHNCGTAGSVFQVQYNNGADWVTVADVSPETDETIMVIFKPVKAIRWRVVFSEGLAFYAGQIKLGKRLVFERGIVGDYIPTNWGHSVEVLGGDTLGGHNVGQKIIRRGRSNTVSLGLLDRTWFEASADPFVDHYNDGKMFFFCGGPRTVPNDLALCWRSNRAAEIQPSYAEGGRYVRISFEVASFVPT